MSMKTIITISLIALAFLVSSPMSFSQVIQNSGFENWIMNPGDTVPQNWQFSGNAGSLGGIYSSSAHNGNYSVLIHTWYGHVHPTLVYGNSTAATFNWTKGGMPVSGKPVSLTGYYKFTEAAPNDSGIVNILLKKYDGINHKIDTVGLGSISLAPSQTFVPFEVKITDLQLGINPDSIAIIFLSGQNTCQIVPTCNFFYLDDLALSFVTGLGSLGDPSPLLTASPNPAGLFLNITTEIRTGWRGRIILQNILGQSLMESDLNLTSDKSVERIDISEFPDGMYILNYESKGKRLSEKILIY